MIKKTVIILISLLFICYEDVAAQKKIEEQTTKINTEFFEMKKNFDESNYEWTFTRVITTEGKSKDELYTFILSSLASIYKDSKEVVQVSERETGLIVAKGFSESDYRNESAWRVSKNRCWHLTTIDIKDGKVRITIKVDNIMAMSGADLRGVVFADIHKFTLNNFYPYWSDCKPKHREVSFANLRYAYNSAINVLDSIEGKLNTMIKRSSDEW